MLKRNVVNTSIFSLIILALLLMAAANSQPIAAQPATPTSQSTPKQQIAFVSQRDGNTEIYVMDADGSNQRRLTNNTVEDGYPCWSPDGQQIAFVSWRSGDAQIYVMDANGNNPHRLTDTSANTSPSWSPDSKQIAFTSERTGQMEIL